MTKKETYRKPANRLRQSFGETFERAYGAIKSRVQKTCNHVAGQFETAEKRKALAFTSARRCGRFMSEALAVFLGIITVCLLYVTSIVLTGEREDPFLRRAARIWISDAFGAHAADIDTFKIAWRSSDNSLAISIDDVVIDTHDGKDVERIDNIQSYLGLPELLAGQIRPYDIRVTGGQLTLRRGADGRLTIGLGSPENIHNLGALWVSPPIQESDIGNTSTQLPETPYRIEAKNVTAYFIGERRGFNIRADTRHLLYEKDDVHFRGRFDATLNTAIGQAPVKVRAGGHADLDYYEIDIEAEAINPADVLMPDGPLAAFRAIDLPLQVQARLSHTPEAGFKIAALQLEGAAGHVSYNGVQEEINHAKLHVAYDGLAERYDISALEIDSAHVKMSGQGSLQGHIAIHDDKRAYPFNLDFTDVNVDAQPLFERALSWDTIDLKGQISTDFTYLDLPHITLDAGHFQKHITVLAEAGQDFSPEALRVKMDVDGVMSSADLLSLWPVPFADGARRWVAGSVKEGHLRNFKVDMNMGPEAFAAGRLKNEDLRLTFDVDGAEVKYIRTMPSVTKAVGSGVLQGNRFDFNIQEGWVGDIGFTGGHVEIPLLWPYGGDFTIDLLGQGSVIDMLHLINYKPFEFADRYGVDPESFAGTGKVHMTITRPLLVHFDQSRIRYAAKGQFSDVTVPFSIGTLGMHDGELILDVDRTGMEVSGPVKIGAWDAELNWKEIFDEGATPTQYTLQGRLGRDGFDSFGIGFREYFSGDVDVSVKAEGRGVNISKADVKADLLNTYVQIGSYWGKDIGEAAILDFQLSRSDDGAFMLENVKAEAEGMSMAGHLSLEPDLRLKFLELARIQIEDVMDGRLSARLNTAQEAIDIDIKGEHFDISPFVAAAINTQTLNTSDATSSGDTTGFTLPLNLNADVEQLDLAEGYSLENAEVSLRSRPTGVLDSHVTGQVDTGELLISLQSKGDKPGRELTVDIPDASAAAQSFLGLDNMLGGRLQLGATLPALGEKGAINGRLSVEEFTLVEAPILTRILSLASLQGLAELLGGTGLSFDVLDIPFSWHEGVLSVRQARASGAALGLTGNGDLDLRAQEVDLDGVLIPAYNTNAMLGNLPVIGGILGGKDDEGVLALNYAVRGPFNRSQVNVNPLSALTPGFIRDIFQVDRDTLPGQTESLPLERPPEVELTPDE